MFLQVGSHHGVVEANLICSCPSELRKGGRRFAAQYCRDIPMDSSIVAFARFNRSAQICLRRFLFASAPTAPSPKRTLHAGMVALVLTAGLLG
jgi:hypothetical protein